MTQDTAGAWVWAELVELYEYRVADVQAGRRPRGGLRALGGLRARLLVAPLDSGLSRRFRAADRLYRAHRAAGTPLEAVPPRPSQPSPGPGPVGAPHRPDRADPAEARAWAELRSLRWERELRAGLERLGRELLAQRDQPGLRVLYAAAESAERGRPGEVAVPAAGDPLVSLHRPGVAAGLLHGAAALLASPSGWGRLRPALLALEAEPLPRHADADVLAAQLRAADREPLAPAAREALVRALREAHPAERAAHERPALREAAAELRRRLEALMEGAPSPGLVPEAALPDHAVLYAATPRAALTAPLPGADTLTVHLAGGRELLWRGLHLSWQPVGGGWQLLAEGPGGRGVALLRPGRPAPERVQTLALGPLLPGDAEDAALRLTLSGAHLALEWLTPPGPGLSELAAQSRIVAALLRPGEGYAGLRLARAVAGLLRGTPVDVEALGPHSAARYAAAPPGALLTLARKGAAALSARAARVTPTALDAALEEGRARLDLGHPVAVRLRQVLLAAHEPLPRVADRVPGGEATLPPGGTFVRLRLPHDPTFLLRAAGTELEVRPGPGFLAVQPPGGPEQELDDLLVLTLPGAQVLLVRALEDLGAAVLTDEDD